MLSNKSSGMGAKSHIRNLIGVALSLAMCMLDFLHDPLNLPGKKRLWLEEICQNHLLIEDVTPRFFIDRSVYGL